MIWGAGSPNDKPKDLILYGLVNSGLSSFVNELNRHYQGIVEAFYLPFTVISPSTLGDAYIKKVGPQLQKLAKHPQTIVDTILGVIGKQIMRGGGMIVPESKVI
jgi:GTPase SAR1 family protein